MFLLQSDSWPEVAVKILLALIGCSGVWLVIREVIRWRRHRKEDAAKVEVAKAGARKTLVEADVTLSDHALQHLKEIKLDYAKEREDNNNLRRELQDTRDELDTAKETLIRLDSKVKHLTFELEKRDETIKQKDIEIEQLMLEIKRYKNSHGGRPH
jgi:uncharacterized membrane protein YcjF (UPF0283 family)